jgi:hypothetical protein
MWPNTFSDRLESWNFLRSQCQSLPVEQTLININQWWFNVPWRPYYLHWDDQATWPDPWQLLSDNVYCDLARGLGILYTITLLDRADLEPVDLVLTEEGHNLVQVAKEKYILNWNKDSILNNKPKVKIIRQLKQHQIK